MKRPKVKRNSARRTVNISVLMKQAEEMDQEERDLLTNLTHDKVDQKLEDQDRTERELAEVDMIDLLLSSSRKKKVLVNADKRKTMLPVSSSLFKNGRFLKDYQKKYELGKPSPKPIRTKRPKIPKKRPPASPKSPPPISRVKSPPAPKSRPRRSESDISDVSSRSSLDDDDEELIEVDERTEWRTHGRRDGKKTFGVALEATDDVPLFMIDALEFLKNFPRQGIFRVCGNKTKLERCKAMLDEGREINLKLLDVSNVSGLVKTWFREYPIQFLAPIVNKSEEIMKDPAKGDVVLKKLINKLSASHKDLLNVTLACCHVLEREKESTKMDDKNLAICIGPAIFRFKKEQLKLIPKSNEVFARMFVEYDKFFPQGLSVLRERKPETKNYKPPEESLIKLTEDEQEEELRSKVEKQALEYTKTVEETVTTKQFKEFRSELKRIRKKQKKFGALAQDLFNIFGYKNKELMFGFQHFLPAKKREKFKVAVETLIRSKEMSSQKYMELVKKALPEKEFKEFKLFSQEQIEEPSNDFNALGKDLLDIFYKYDPSLAYGFQVYIREQQRINFTAMVDALKKIEDKKNRKKKREELKKRKKLIKKEQKIEKKKEKLRQKVAIKEKKLKQKRRKIEEKKRKERIIEIGRMQKEFDRSMGKFQSLIKERKLHKIMEYVDSSKDQIDINGYYLGLTPLHWAVLCGDKQIVGHFLDDPDVVVNSISLKPPPIKTKGMNIGRNVTPLMIAAIQSRKAIVKLMLKNDGIDVKVTNENGKMCEDFCKNSEIKKMLREYRLKEEKMEKDFSKRMVYLNQTFADYTIFIQENEEAKKMPIRTLKFILMRSKYLADAIKREKKIVESDKYSVEKCLDFLSGKEPKIRKTKLYDVFKQAQKWKIYNLMYIVLKKIQEKINLKDMIKILSLYIKEEEYFRDSVFELACFKKLKMRFADQLQISQDIERKLADKITELDCVFLRSKSIIDHEDLMDLTKRELSTLGLFNNYITDLLTSNKETNFELIPNDDTEPIEVHREILLLNSEYFTKLFRKEKKIKFANSFVVKEMDQKMLKRYLKFTYSNIVPKSIEYNFKFLKFADKDQSKILVKTILKKSEKKNCLKMILKWGFLVKEADKLSKKNILQKWNEKYEKKFVEQLLEQSEVFAKRINSLKSQVRAKKKPKYTPKK